MEGQPARMGRSGFGGTGAAKRWVSHARHDEAAPPPHRPVLDRAGEPHPVSRPQPATRPVKLDGASGEGGGQILRTALGLAMITGRPFRIDRIRANRDKPGLRAQHLKAVEAAALLCGAEVVGASLGSRSLAFHPGPVEARDLDLDVGTAGSTALVLHTIHLPLAIRADRPVLVRLTGGTFNLAAPSYPFLATTWRGHMAALGLPVALTSPAAGFFPQGGGRLDAWIEPGQPRALGLAGRGPLVRIRAEAGVAHLDRSIAGRMLDRVASRLDARGLAVEASLATWAGPGPGTALTLAAEHADAPPAAFVGLGRRGVSAEAVADEAVAELLAYLDAPGALDPHSADQVLIPLALADGPSTYTVTAVTEHLRTNVAPSAPLPHRPSAEPSVPDSARMCQRKSTVDRPRRRKCTACKRLRLHAGRLAYAVLQTATRVPAASYRSGRAASVSLPICARQWASERRHCRPSQRVHRRGRTRLGRRGRWSGTTIGRQGGCRNAAAPTWKPLRLDRLNCQRPMTPTHRWKPVAARARPVPSGATARTRRRCRGPGCVGRGRSPRPAATPLGTP